MKKKKKKKIGSRIVQVSEYRENSMDLNTMLIPMHLKRLLNRRLRVSPLIFLSQNSRAIVERPNIL